MPCRVHSEYEVSNGFRRFRPPVHSPRDHTIRPCSSFLKRHVWDVEGTPTVWRIYARVDSRSLERLLKNWRWG